MGFNVILQPPTERVLTEVRERFELPYDMPLPMVEGFSQGIGRNAIEKYERLRGWSFRDDIPVTLDVSELQFDLGLFGGSVAPPAQDQKATLLAKGRTAYVLKMWFEVPATRTEVFDDGDKDGTGTEDGFVPVDSLFDNKVQNG